MIYMVCVNNTYQHHTLYFVQVINSISSRATICLVADVHFHGPPALIGFQTVIDVG